VLKWHSRRVTAMAFHPFSSHVLVSGDKSGAIHTLNTDADLGASIDRNVRRSVLQLLPHAPRLLLPHAPHLLLPHAPHLLLVAGAASNPHWRPHQRARVR
jgi:hypothetical protein